MPAVEISGERRSRRRYSVDLPLRFKEVKKRVVISTGTGRAVNMSSKGIAFTANKSFESGAILELKISWPTLLHGKTPINLIVKGKVVRSDGQLAAVQITKYEFRTQRSTLF